MDKAQIYSYLNKNKITELHTHLMGMGDANFWINDILIGFLCSENNIENDDVFYPIETFIEAVTGKKMVDYNENSNSSNEYLKHSFETLFYNSMPENIGSIEDTFFIKKEDGKVVISNKKLIEIMSHEVGLKNQPFHSLIKNCFQFLNLNGEIANQNEVLKTCFSFLIFLLL
jgi:hypothetical protein